MAVHALSECMKKDCSKPPTHEILWANGKGHCWFCHTHLLSWVRKQTPPDTKKYEPDIQSIKVVVKGQASQHWRDNTTSNVKDAVLKVLSDINLSRGYSDPPLSKCMEKDCSKPPTHEVLWAEGMGHCWFCRPHLISWVKKHVKECKEEGWGLDVDYIKVVKDNKASIRFRDNKTIDVLVLILKGIKSVSVVEKKSKIVNLVEIGFDWSFPVSEKSDGTVGGEVEMGSRESGVRLTEDAVEDLIAIVKDTEKNYELRSQAISILGKINPVPSDVIDLLIDIAESEKDRGLRGSALYALGQDGLPSNNIGPYSQRIADFLAKLMKESDDREIAQQAGSALAGIMLRRARHLNFEADLLGLSMKMADGELEGRMD